jgi:DNA-binding CsgD family transcriptional regulator
MTDLEALVVAAYVFADEYRVPPRRGRPALTSDAELVALAVCQAAIGASSELPPLRWTGSQYPGFRGLAFLDSGCPPGTALPRGLEELTAREREVLELVGRGLSKRRDRYHLFVAETTVKTHAGQILRKLDRVQTVVLAYETGSCGRATTLLRPPARTRCCRHWRVKGSLLPRLPAAARRRRRGRPGRAPRRERRPRGRWRRP